MAFVCHYRVEASNCDSLFIDRIIGVATRVESVKSVPVVSIQGQPEPDALWQVGIRDEMPSEGHQIGITISNGSLRSVRLKSASRDSRSRENFSESRCGDVPLALGDQDVTLDARLNNVQVSESKSVQLLCDVIKQSERIAIRDSIPSSAGRDAHRVTRLPPHTETIASTT